MNHNILHSIVVGLMAFALPFMVSCSHQEESLSEVVETALCLRVSTIGSTRASVSDLLGNEKMRTLRVVLLDEDGNIEHNRFFPLVDSEYEEKRIYLKVKPNEDKKVFLFANEESVSSIEGGGESGTLKDFFKKYEEVGASGFEDAVNELYFAPQYSVDTAIPMSSMYEISIGDEGSVEKQFYVVRVATKFEVKFINWRGEDVTVNKFTVEKHADKNFLMARVQDTPRNNTVLNGKTWIDWLKDVSEASSAEDNNAATEAAGWLKDYELPSSAVLTNVYESGPITVEKPNVESANPENWTPGVANAPIFYLPESKNPKAGSTEEQEYAIKFYIAGRPEPFICPMTALKSLFRNTHLLLTVTMYSPNDFQVDVLPYESIELEPVFGLTYDPISGYRIVRNSATGEIQYWLDSSNNKLQLKTDTNRNYTLAYRCDQWGNQLSTKADHWFDAQGNKKSLVATDMAELTAVTDEWSNPLYWYDEDLDQKWLVQNNNYSVLVYQFYPGSNETINDCNPYGEILYWVDYTGQKHDGFKNDEFGWASFNSEEAAIVKDWKEFLSSIN